VNAYVWEEMPLSMPVDAVATDPKQRLKEILHDTVDTLTPEQIDAVHSLLIKQIRDRDTKLIVEFMGRKEVVDIIEKIFIYVYKPLVQVYKHTNLNALVSSISSMLKATIAIADKCEAEKKRRQKPREGWKGKYFGGKENEEIVLDTETKSGFVTEYKAAMWTFLEEFYVHIREIFVKDETQTLQKLTAFFFRRFQVIQSIKKEDEEPFDFLALVKDNLTKDQMKVLLEVELPAIIEYERTTKRRKIEMMNMNVVDDAEPMMLGSFPVLESLVPPFVEKCTAILEEAKGMIPATTLSDQSL